MEIHRVIQDPIQTNCYIITNNSSTIIIDPGNEAQVEEIKQHIKGELKAIILTHAHFDHAMAAHCFDVPTYMHKDEQDQLDFHKQLTLQATGQELILPKEIKLFEKQMKFGDISFEVMHTPGHTNGSVCLLFENNILISGDTLFEGACGRTDIGGNDDQMRDSLHKLAELNPKLIVLPGHGEQTTIEKERKWMHLF